MSLLESSPAVLHGQILGCIADTCEHSEAVREFLDWKSDVTSKTAVQVMIQLWRQQETRLHIADETTGYVVNQERPLAGTGAMLEPFREELATMQDTADAAERRAMGAGTLSAVRDQVMAELSEQDVKAKVFSVMCKCGFEGQYETCPRDVFAALADETLRGPGLLRGATDGSACVRYGVTELMLLTTFSQWL